jgi:putative nucleotide binding protein
MEDYAHILDYLPQGLPAERGFRHEPLAYALGEIEFKLFELVPKPNVQITIGERVYIGKEAEQRDKIAHVKRRVGYEELTAAAHAELPFVIADVAKQNEVRFVQFFNEAQAITTRFHMLELLPGLGKKTMWAIVEEKKKGPLRASRTSPSAWRRSNTRRRSSPSASRWSSRTRRRNITSS